MYKIYILIIISSFSFEAKAGGATLRLKLARDQQVRDAADRATAEAAEAERLAAAGNAAEAEAARARAAEAHAQAQSAANSIAPEFRTIAAGEQARAQAAVGRAEAAVRRAPQVQPAAVRIQALQPGRAVRALVEGRRFGGDLAVINVDGINPGNGAGAGAGGVEAMAPAPIMPAARPALAREAAARILPVEPAPAAVPAPIEGEENLPIVEAEAVPVARPVLNENAAAAKIQAVARGRKARQNLPLDLERVPADAPAVPAPGDVAQNIAQPPLPLAPLNHQIQPALEPDVDLIAPVNQAEAVLVPANQIKGRPVGEPVNAVAPKVTVLPIERNVDEVDPGLAQAMADRRIAIVGQKLGRHDSDDGMVGQDDNIRPIVPTTPIAQRREGIALSPEVGKVLNQGAFARLKLAVNDDEEEGNDNWDHHVPSAARNRVAGVGGAAAGPGIGVGNVGDEEAGGRGVRQAGKLNNRWNPDANSKPMERKQIVIERDEDAFAAGKKALAGVLGRGGPGRPRVEVPGADRAVIAGVPGAGEDNDSGNGRIADGGVPAVNIGAKRDVLAGLFKPRIANGADAGPRGDVAPALNLPVRPKPGQHPVVAADGPLKPPRPAIAPAAQIIAAGPAGGPPPAPGARPRVPRPPQLSGQPGGVPNVGGAGVMPQVQLRKVEPAAGAGGGNGENAANPVGGKKPMDMRAELAQRLAGRRIE